MQPILPCLILSSALFLAITCYPRPQNVEFVPGVQIQGDTVKMAYETCEKACNQSCAETGFLFGFCHYDEKCYCIDQAALDAPDILVTNKSSTETSKTSEEISDISSTVPR